MSGAIRKNAREEIRITLDDFKGLQLVNLRVWFDTGNGEYRPGKQGLAFRLDLLPEVLKALGALEGGAA
ncbi:transcriptional coactivator p15/PC4 family protein [Paracoccus luteus]|uniref:transcriptional coactivator p15/PC4 family protein n=1 Tax=Paracoccus luteus TaxID=2508543 RepID=UPI00106FA56C|nr:transcriptional coactivator p15/PC4 family protein [Paracoccus luteus]